MSRPRAIRRLPPSRRAEQRRQYLDRSSFCCRRRSKRCSNNRRDSRRRCRSGRRKTTGRRCAISSAASVRSVSPDRHRRPDRAHRQPPACRARRLASDDLPRSRRAISRASDLSSAATAKPLRREEDYPILSNASAAAGGAEGASSATPAQNRFRLRPIARRADYPARFSLLLSARCERCRRCFHMHPWHN